MGRPHLTQKFFRGVEEPLIRRNQLLIADSIGQENLSHLKAGLKPSRKTDRQKDSNWKVANEIFGKQGCLRGTDPGVAQENRQIDIFADPEGPASERGRHFAEMTQTFAQSRGLSAKRRQDGDIFPQGEGVPL